MSDSCLYVLPYLADMSRVGAISTDGAQAALGDLRRGAGLSLNAELHAGWGQR